MTVTGKTLSERARAVINFQRGSETTRSHRAGRGRPWRLFVRLSDQSSICTYRSGPTVPNGDDLQSFVLRGLGGVEILPNQPYQRPYAVQVKISGAQEQRMRRARQDADNHVVHQLEPRTGLEVELGTECHRTHLCGVVFVLTLSYFRYLLFCCLRVWVKRFALFFMRPSIFRFGTLSL